MMGYVLVVYDNLEDLNNVRLFLHVSGYDAKAFSSWEEARKAFDGDSSCDLVITKARISGVTASDIAEYIKNSRIPQTPIIAINSAGDDIDPGLFNSILTPPFALKVLGEEVSSFVAPKPDM
jgi:CheY-like chemotaxis protein